jgi:transcriptional regulator with XRE-family HTH domain
LKENDKRISKGNGYGYYNHKASFPRSLKFQRLYNGYTQKDLASILKINTRTISNWEHGIGSPRASQLFELAKLFNVSMDKLWKSS